MKKREHLRENLVRRGLVADSCEAERMILAARVKVDGSTVTQAGAWVSPDAIVELTDSKKYVSRGGYKLEGALEDFSFSPAGKTCIDVGASTGGFTDCLIQRGARQVVAVDVGYGQFDWRLRQDKRVVLFERTNIARVDPRELGAPFEVLVADLSFTSLTRLASTLADLLTKQGSCLTLVKPQFELPKDLVKDGIIRSFDLHVQALSMVMEAYKNNDLIPQGVSYSPILGAKGNVEFWIWAIKHGVTATIDEREIVRQSHRKLLS